MMPPRMPKLNKEQQAWQKGLYEELAIGSALSGLCVGFIIGAEFVKYLYL
tara:strand:+ start:25 stop:174 length:150 start_codon:yes stop_codon:yes gene_type:complete